MNKMEDINYSRDARVVAADENRLFTILDTSRSTMKVQLDDCIVETLIEEELRPEDFDGILTVPCKFIVCPLCEGRGTHVNPSIDCNGLTAEDFDEDPDFREEYMNGTYDVPCNQCGGNNVVPEVTFPADIQERIDDVYRARAEERRNAAYGY
jgi:hypothetical protein